MTEFDRLVRRKEPSYPLQAEHHDVLVLKSPTGLYRARADKTNGKLETPLERVPGWDDGYRKAVRMATGSETPRGARSEMGLSLLPVKPEPASAAFSCYLVNASFFQDAVDAVEVTVKTQAGEAWQVDEHGIAPASARETEARPVAGVSVAFRKERDGTYFVDATRLDFVNTFTRAEWSSVEAVRRYAVDDSDPKLTSLILNSATHGLLSVARIGEDQADARREDARALPAALSRALHQGALIGTMHDVAFVNLAALPEPGSRLLVAMPDGVVRDLRIDGDTGAVGSRAFDEAALKRHPEVWRLLRNGCVLGRARVDDAPATVFNLCSLRGSRTVEDPTHPLQGTLDFKWSPGQCLRIAFQRSSTSGAWVEAAKASIERLLGAWLVRANLDLTIVREDVPPLLAFFPPAGGRGARLCDVEYDILVNLDPLPVTVPMTARVDPERRIAWPTSDLGSYALRRSYGVPTMFLGRPPGHAEPLETYFDSLRFKHLALHELGHALGLPHLFQSPALRRPPFLDDLRAIQRILKQALRVEVDDRFVTEELLRKWTDPVNNPYSEWPVAYARHARESDAQLVQRWARASVMMGPPVQAIYRENALLGDLREHDAPQAVDASWISELYPQRSDRETT